ncbi:MAG: tetraacyldisaccharide 4'-kinase [Pseudomonadota bacterium]
MKESHSVWLNAWYGKSKWVYLLLPLNWLFCCVSWLRKCYLIQFAQESLAVPVIVVGNISIGGTGKTPLIIALVEYLQQQGHTPGVVSRGYGGKAPHYPYLLNDLTQAKESGDEPLLVFRATKCSVCVAPDRVAAAKLLVEQGCSIVLSDDGLQHYRLGRDIEIAVVDGSRRFGNTYRLPVGPLREPISRLKAVDIVVLNNSLQSQFPVYDFPLFNMKLHASAWRQVQGQQLISLDKLQFEKSVHAVAGIGNPQRFFNTLDGLSLTYQPHIFADHHKFSAADFQFANNDPVVMTEKDAVKCQSFAKPQWYSLIVNAQLDTKFWQLFKQKLHSVQQKLESVQ